MRKFRAKEAKKKPLVRRAWTRGSEGRESVILGPDFQIENP